MNQLIFYLLAKFTLPPAMTLLRCSGLTRNKDALPSCKRCFVFWMAQLFISLFECAMQFTEWLLICNRHINYWSIHTHMHTHVFVNFVLWLQLLYLDNLYREIWRTTVLSQDLETTRLDVIMTVSLWNLQASRQRFYLVACHISKRLEKSKPESRGFETSQDLVVRRPPA